MFALLDELAANALAAPTVQLVDGWLLRAAPHWPFRRTSSALPLHPRGDATSVLPIVEDFYERRDLPARVQLSSSAPLGLDAALEARGYDVEAPVDILVREREGIDISGRNVVVTVGTVLARETIDAVATADARLTAYAEMLPAIGPPAFVATAMLERHTVGVALAVVEREWVGIFGMRTRLDARRRGVAAALLGTLRSLAPNCYLQVETDNDAARQLYERAGFARAYGYHYRTRRDD